MWPFSKKNIREQLSFSEKIRRIILATLVSVVGIVFFKLLPMMIWGDMIKYDVSFHIIVTILVLYVLWFFIDQNPTWRVPFFMVSSVIIIVVAVQRLLVDAHNDIGILFTFVISIVALSSAEWRDIKDKLSF